MSANLFSRWIKAPVGLKKKRDKRQAFRQTFKPWLEALEDRLALATLIVNNVADNATDTIHLTLREAITLVNNGGNLNSLGQLSMPTGWQSQITGTFGTNDTIQFQGGLSGVIDLSTSEGGQGGLSLSENVKIDGTGASIAIEGGNTAGSATNAQVFVVNFGVNAVLDELTITNGFASNGGGITNSGTLTVSNSILSDNTCAGDGGGIYNSGAASTLTVSNSTFANNSASNGGGIYNDSGTVTVNNGTLSGNAAINGGGISNFGEDAFGQIYGVLNLTNTIVANSTSGGDLYDNGLAAIVAQNNLIQSTNYIQNGDNGNIVGEDPLLSPLDYYGGPTQTFALLPGSPAIDAGDARMAFSTDQRGLDRVVGGHVDLGAFESQPLVVNTTADSAATAFGQLSLRQAIALANVRPGNDAITFDPNVFGTTQTITLAGGALALNDTTGTTTIEGPGANLLTINGNSASGVFSVTSGASTLLDSLTIANGNASFGGGIYNDGTVSVGYCTLSGNQATDGGGIYSRGTLTVSYCTLVGNSASLDGGGINGGGTVSVGNSTLAGNSASGAGAGGGGGIYTTGSLTVGNSTLAGNSAGGAGGGILNNQGTVTAWNSTFAGNYSAGIGGGIYNYGTMNVRSSTLSDNSADNGGGIYSYLVLNLTNTIVADNTGLFYGPDVSGAISAANYNLIGNNAGTSLLAATTGSTPDSNGNLIGSAASPISPLLAPLANYGGTTQTMALLTGSLALGSGDVALAAGFSIDQRGFPRVVNGAVDIGAFETQSNPPSLDAILQQSLQQNNPFTVQAYTQTDATNAIIAVNALASPNSGSETVTLNLAPLPPGSSYSDLNAGPHPGVTLVIYGLPGGLETIVGKSPALTVSSGTVIVTGITLTTATDAPTILVTGGSLTLRNDTVQSSTGFADAAISVTGGTVDLGTTGDPGNNIINITGQGQFIRNTTSSSVSTTGDTFEINGTPDPKALSFTTLATFNGSNGEFPVSGVVADDSGNIFGTTQHGGASGTGEVYEVAKGSGTVTVVASFPSSYGGGSTNTNGSVILDSSGNLFGTAGNGGGGSFLFEVAAGSGTVTTLGQIGF
ncbi:MAG TPA: choice-of-anchor Q domain-containing protein, partial [Pirellulales bacterium]|nr:choice-of-anchor Q domain-containing protein [Pirellulales bacterium]